MQGDPAQAHKTLRRPNVVSIEVTLILLLVLVLWKPKEVVFEM